MRVYLSLWMCFAALLVAQGCAAQKAYNLPPAERLMEPGPGVGGPGPGVLPPALPPLAIAPVPAHRVQVLFASPEGLQVQWDSTGMGQFDSVPLIVPGRYDFPEGFIYRLKLTNIAEREGVELYPTLELAPTTPRTAAYLAHNAVPVQFTEEDFDQVLAGNFVTKVIFLPDPDFQALALPNVETLVSTRLDPGMDPIVEADRRGSILAIVRIGNKDVETAAAFAGGEILPGGAVGSGLPYDPHCMMPGAMPPNYVAGVTSPTWGMPMSGTPIGLPGPPHVPLGVPAGLQKHVMKNHTNVHLPEPTENFQVHVRQQPGLSYPRPTDRMWIKEQNFYPPQAYGQPHDMMHQHVH